MSISNKVGLGIVAVWFVVCTVLIVRFGVSNKHEFDPNMRLSQAIMDVSFDQALFTKLVSTGNVETNSPSVFHFVQGNCYCEWLAQPHKTKLDSWSTDNQFVNHYINIAEHPQLAQFVPSTPAVAAFDAQQQLIYFGPYSRGTGCYSNSGEIDTQLANWLKQKGNEAIPMQATIDTDATGCYCET